MTEYFVGTLKGCNDLISKMDAVLGYPNPATNTDTYAKPMAHASLRNVFFVIIKPTHSPRLERESLLSDITAGMSAKERVWKTGESLTLEGAFPFYRDSVA